MVVSSLTGDFLQQSAAHKVMADYVKENNARMIFISTANVFDGAVSGSHSEQATPYPISQYGDFKKSTEEMLLWILGKNCLVARLPKIIEKNHAEDYITHIKKGNSIYSNLFFNYNTPENVANALKFCIEKNKHGIVHLVSRDYISEAKRAAKTLKKAGLNLDYQTIEFTPESFCSLLNCNDITKLRQSTDGNFYLTMTCTDKEILSRFNISCEEALS
jgi:dTDP-4-dehydrorhamnose reductase